MILEITNANPVKYLARTAQEDQNQIVLAARLQNFYIIKHVLRLVLLNFGVTNPIKLVKSANYLAKIAFQTLLYAHHALKITSCIPNRV